MIALSLPKLRDSAALSFPIDTLLLSLQRYSLLRSIIINVWEVRNRNCMVMIHVQCQSSPGGLGGTAGVEGQRYMYM